MSSTTSHGRVALGETRRDVPAYLTMANAVHDGMTAASSTFTAPQPPMATLLSLIQAATAAQQAAATRARGLAAVRDEKVCARAPSVAASRKHLRGRRDIAPLETLTTASWLARSPSSVLSARLHRR